VHPTLTGLRSLVEITCCGGSSNRAPAGAANTKHDVMINLKRQGLVRADEVIE
jgi:hypothetical protein